MEKNLTEIIHINNKYLPNINIKIKGISTDSRLIKHGYLFIATLECKKNMKLYILEAINNGAIAVLQEVSKNNHQINWLQKIPIIGFYKLKENISKILGNFYENPSKSLQIAGVTGTNGKTTTVHFLSQWVHLLGYKSALISTIGNGIYNQKLENTRNTTESQEKNQKFLHEFLLKKVKFVAIEVSSHGISQKRIENVHFDAAAFTNLTQDHLDYHKNISNYKNTKLSFFKNFRIKNKIINIDDKVGFTWIRKFPQAVAVSTKAQSKNLNNPYLYVKKLLKTKNNKTKILFDSSWGSGNIKVNFLDVFNIQNMLIAFATLLILDYPILDLVYYSKYLKMVSGRMKLIKQNNKPSVIIDYAHNPESLKQALLSIKKNFKGNVWCIFGCGGNRDKSKRSIMGNIAVKHADKVIITNDNPRDENPKKIFKDIIQNLDHSSFKIIPNRVKAIETAIKYANKQDCVLLAGKGHEEYQIFKDKNLYHSDYKTVKKIFKLYDTYKY